MAISDQLFAAILAMDAYNRGYGAQINLSGVGASDKPDTPIGDATIIGSDGLDPAQAVGFYAIAYRWNGQTVISFRGTDNAAFLSSASDIWNGWVGGAGFITTQAARAEAFYKAVTGSSIADGTVGNVLLTGHSLGGGLAGYIAALTGDKASIFDNMPYGAAAMQRYIGENVAAGINNIASLFNGEATSPYATFPNASGITAEYTSGEVLTAVRALGVPAAFLTNGSLAAAAAAVLPFEETDLAPLDAYAGSSADAGSLHSIALLVLLQYARDNGLTDWRKVAPELFKAYFNDSVGSALGLVQGQGQTGTGLASSSGQMLDAIAYTALSTNAPFGTTALQSLYHDAGTLGTLVSNGQLAALSNIAPTTGSGAYASGSFDLVEQALADVIVQYAGDQAISSTTDQKFSNGAFATDSQKLFVNLDPSNWAATYGAVNNSAGQKKVIGASELGSVLLKSYANDQLDSNSDTTEFAFINSLGDQVSGIAAHATEIQVSIASGASLDATAAPKTYDGKPGGAILVGNPDDDTIKAGDGDNLIFGGTTVEAGDGNNIIVEEASDGSIKVGGGTNCILGSQATITVGSSTSSLKEDAYTLAVGDSETLKAGIDGITMIGTGNNDVFEGLTDQALVKPDSHNTMIGESLNTFVAPGTASGASVSGDTFNAGFSNNIMIGSCKDNTFNIDYGQIDYSKQIAGINVIWGGGNQSEYNFTGPTDTYYTNMDVFILYMDNPSINAVNTLDVAQMASHYEKEAESKGFPSTNGITFIINPTKQDTVSYDGCKLTGAWSGDIYDGTPWYEPVGTYEGPEHYSGILEIPIRSWFGDKLSLVNFVNNDFGVNITSSSIPGGEDDLTLPSLLSYDHQESISNGSEKSFDYTKGGGQDVVSNSDYHANSNNVLHLHGDVTASQITVANDSQGNVLITDGTAGDQIKLDQELTGTAFGVQSVTFDDGTSLSRTQLIARATTGTTGADQLYGSVGADVFDGKGAPAGSQDYEQGEGGNDTFIYDQGYGHLEINEQDHASNPSNTLQFGGDITAEQTTVTEDSSGNVYLTDGVAGDQVKLDYELGYYYDPSYGVQKVQFADGTTWSKQQLLTMATTGTSGADSLYGTSGADTFDGKGAPAGSQDYEQGNGDADTFIYNQGYGQLEINEFSGGGSSTAVLRFGPGVTLAQLNVSADSANDLILTDGTLGNQVKIDEMTDLGYFGDAQYGVEQVQFADGSFATRQQLVDLTTTGTAGADSLHGAAGGSTLDGKGAPIGSQDYEEGKSGADTFVYNPGYGHLEISENTGYHTNASVLQFGPGITQAQLIITNDGLGNLVITDGTSNDRIQIDGMIGDRYSSNADYGVAKVTFTDGTSLDSHQLQALAASGAADFLYGTSGADIIDGKGAPAGSQDYGIYGASVGSQDYEEGFGGGDTFVYNAGYGRLAINESDYSGSTNVLQLGAGITAAQVIVTGDSLGDLFIADGVSGDQVKLIYESSDPHYGVQQVQFADGTNWSRQQLLAMAMRGTSGADSLYGTPDADTFDGKGAPAGSQDYEHGGGGGDTFIYNQGYGQLEVDETDDQSSDTNLLRLGAGITTAQLTVTRDNSGNIYLADGTAGDQIKLDGELNGSSYGLQSVQLADGTSLSKAQLAAMADWKTGTTGADRLYASASAETFDGKGAPAGSQDYEQGGGGNDTFIYNQGYGQLEVDETDYQSSDTNVLLLGAGITASQLHATTDSSGNVYLTDGTEGDEVKIDNMLALDPTSGSINQEYGIQSVQLADGSTLTRDQLITLATQPPASEIDGTPGSDFLEGASGPDLIDGKGGDDDVFGSGGGDTFVFDQGYGKLSIVEQEPGTATNVLRFGPGIDPSQIKVSADDAGRLVIAVGSGGDQVSLVGFFYDPSYGVQKVQFADGTSWSREQIVSMELAGTPGADHIEGTTGPDLIDGHGGNDYEQGNGGGDTFVFDRGYGQLTVDEDESGTATNVLQFGPGIDPSQVKVEGTASNDLTLSVGSNGDQVMLDHMAFPSYGVQQVQFADGTTWSASQLFAMELAGGTSGADTLVGTQGADLIDGHGGDDYERGNGGGDTFVFDQGYGQLEINEEETGTAINVLQFGAGIDPSQIKVSGTAANDLTLAVGGSADQVKLDGMLSPFQGEYSSLEGVQQVRFADGTTWSVPQLIAMELAGGTPGADTLVGTDGADLIDGRGGDDYEQGNYGDDTYVFDQGYGKLEVSAESGTLELGPGIDPAQVRVTGALPSGVKLLIGSDGDQVTLDFQMWHDGFGGGVDQVQFADGTTWSASQLIAMELNSATPGADTLVAASDAIRFDGQGGGDVEEGSGGADTFVFDQGYSKLEIIEDYNDQANLQLGSGIAPSQVQVKADVAGDLILTFGTEGDQVTIDQALVFNHGYQTKGVGQLAFSDGTTWSFQQMVQQELSSASSGNDTLVGSNGADLIDGKGGSDYEQGNGGDDTFVFNQGYGALEINEDSGLSAQEHSDAVVSSPVHANAALPSPDQPNPVTAVLNLGPGIDAAAVAVSADQANDLLLSIQGSGGQIKIDKMLAPDPNGGVNQEYGIQTIQFADGTAWDRTHILALAGR